MSRTRFRATVLVGLLGCAACAGDTTPSPTAPSPGSPAATAFDGAWSGSFIIAACGGRRHCGFSIGQLSPFVLRLSRVGSQVSGVFQAEFFSIPVSGTVSDSGSLSLRGGRPSPGPNSAAVELTSFTSQSADLLQAQLTYEVRYPDTAPATTDNRLQSISGRVSQATRGAVTLPTSFQGTWRGTMFIRDCSTVGWLFCWPEGPLTEHLATFALTQTGDRVSGTVTLVDRVLNLSGTVSGTSVTFDAVADERPVSSARDVFRLERSTLTRDAVGQLTGSVRYVRETIWDAALNRQTYVSRYDTNLSAILIP